MSRDLPPPINANETKSDNKGFMAKLSKSAGAATKLVALQTERTKLNTLTLPAAYRALGKDCLQQKRHLDCVPELTSQLRSVLAEIKQLSESATTQDRPQSFTDKAKAAGKQALDVARQKQLGMKRDSIIAAVGKAIYEQHSAGSGPIELVSPIQKAIGRIAELDAEIAQQSQVGRGSALTPKRMLLCVGAIGLIAIIVAMRSLVTTGSTDQLVSNEGQYIDESLPIDSGIQSRANSSPALDSRSSAASWGTSEGKSPVVEVIRSPEQKKAIAEIAKLKGSMFVDPTKSTKPVVKVVFKSREIRGPDLIVLSQLPTIEELDIANTSVTDLTHLKSMPNLSVLHTPRLLPEQFKILATLPKLTTLWCSVKNPVQREMTRGHLTEALTNLTSAPALRHLRIDSCDDGASDVQVGMGAYSPLPKFTRLTYLHVGDTLFDGDLAFVSKCNELEYIVLGWNAYIIRGRSTAAAREAKRSAANFGSRSVSEVTSAIGIRQLASCVKLKTLVFDGSIDDSILQAAATLPACPELVYAGNSGLSDSTVNELKNSKPEFQFRVGQSTEIWNTVAGNPQLVNINDLPRSTPRSQGQGASSNWSGVAEPMDMEERYKALVNRVKPGMSKEQVEAILGMADESNEQDMGDLNPQKAGQILDICTWHGDTESQSSIILSFVNGRLQDGGTPGYDIRKGFSPR